MQSACGEESLTIPLKGGREQTFPLFQLPVPQHCGSVRRRKRILGTVAVGRFDLPGTLHCQAGKHKQEGAAGEATKEQIADMESSEGFAAGRKALLQPIMQRQVAAPLHWRRLYHGWKTLLAQGKDLSLASDTALELSSQTTDGVCCPPQHCGAPQGVWN